MIEEHAEVSALSQVNVAEIRRSGGRGIMRLLLEVSEVPIMDS